LRYLRRFLFTLARTAVFGTIIAWIFAHMSFAIPVHRLRETDLLLAFYHPKPSYPLHILIVPKRQIPNMMALQPTDADFLVDLMVTVQSLVQELHLDETGYSLITNGGTYQDVPQLHYHLYSLDEKFQASKQ
jgi:histidine triad (HIT) family protein